ncbi:MAG: hypothetical protein ABEJ31_00540 [Haloarculaceae archaeon]
MVSDSLPRGPAGDRAQLLLVGSLAMAFVIIGLTIVVNTVLITENVATSDALEQTNGLTDYDFQARRDVQAIATRINHQQRDWTTTQLNTAMTANVDRYGRLVGETYSTRSSVFVDVTYNDAGSDFGTRIIQSEDGQLDHGGSGTPWRVVQTSDRRDVGRLLFNVNMSAGGTGFTVRAGNASGDTMRITFHQSTGGNLRVDTDRSAPVVCETYGDRALVDAVHGQTYMDDCNFPGLDSIQPPYNVTIRDGSSADTQFELVTNGTTPPAVVSRCTGGSSDPQPCWTRALWTANVTVTYDSPSVTANQTHDVEVYP